MLRLNTNLDVLNPQQDHAPVRSEREHQLRLRGRWRGLGAGLDVRRRPGEEGLPGRRTGTCSTRTATASPTSTRTSTTSRQTRYVGKFRKCGANPAHLHLERGEAWSSRRSPPTPAPAPSEPPARRRSWPTAASGPSPAGRWARTRGSTPTTATVEFTDNGLYPRIPNLLEPADPLNNALGLGHLIFLNADDDSDTTTKALVPVADISNKVDGVPDYDVSAYDGNGRPLPAGSNPDPGRERSTTARSTSARCQGGREIIFYLVVFYTSQSQARCLGRIGGVCKLWLNSPIQVFFSRPTSTWTRTSPSPTRRPRSTSAAGTRDTCTVDGGTYTGWLDQATLTRLASPDGGYGLVMPHEVVIGPAPDHQPHAPRHRRRARAPIPSAGSSASRT